MWQNILGISVFQHCRPYIKKHISSTLNDCEFLFLNSIFIMAITTIYVFFYRGENYKNVFRLNGFQYFCLFLFAFITVFSSLEIFKLEAQSIITTNVLLKAISFLIFVILGMFVFNEELSYPQILGFIIIISGIYISQLGGGGGKK